MRADLLTSIPTDIARVRERNYPIGLGTDLKTVRSIIEASPHEAQRNEALAILTELTKKGPGNPTGANQHIKAEDGTLHNVQSSSTAPTGNSSEAGIRRLQKEAGEGNPEAQEK